MPYVIDRRVSGSRKTELEYQSGSNPIRYRSVDGVTSYESTYGWRTGPNVKSDEADPRLEYHPPKGGTLADVLAYRKNFIEQVVTNAATRNALPGSTHFLLSDRGNEFANTKLSVRAGNNYCFWKAGLPSATTKIWNASPTLMYWLDQTGTMVAGSPVTDFGGYLRGKGLKEFDGTGNHGLSTAQTNSIATSAIGVMNPIQSHASVLTTLLELVSGDVPGVYKNLLKHLKTIQDIRGVTSSGLKGAASFTGGSFLENVFGWTPMLKDINAAIQVLTTIDSLLFPEDSTRRNFKRVIHERFGTLTGNVALGSGAVLAGSMSADERSIFVNANQGTYFASPGTAPTVFTARETIDVRVTARFNTSMVPSAQSNGYLDKLQVLLGLQLTPQVLWDITPWSWLVDWFGNIGSVVENLSNIHASNLILNYAYATFRREAVSGVWAKPVLSGSSSGWQSLSGDFITEYTTVQKVRLRASPYGFGTALSSLNPNQWAVLTALGLARAR